MDLKQYKAAIEAMLFAYAEPVSADKLANVLEIETSVVERLLMSIKDEYETSSHGIELLQLENEWQLATKSEALKRELAIKKMTKLQKSALINTDLNKC
ncbi:MAG: SMC-Scp complex subunit ScpB [Oscillospiraceae bacterium]